MIEVQITKPIFAALIALMFAGLAFPAIAAGSIVCSDMESQHESASEHDEPWNLLFAQFGGEATLTNSYGEVRTFQVKVNDWELKLFSISGDQTIYIDRFTGRGTDKSGKLVLLCRPLTARMF